MDRIPTLRRYFPLFLLEVKHEMEEELTQEA